MNINNVDEYIRDKMHYFSPQHHSIEPHAEFTGRVMNQILLVERQHRIRMNVLFCVVALGPIALREIWFFIRNDFISVTELPLGHMVSQVYNAFLSPMTTYAFMAGGLLLAVFIVGFPHWHIARK